MQWRKCFYVSNKKASLGLSIAIRKKSVPSVIVEIGRAKERPPKRPGMDKMAHGRSRMRISGERRNYWPWRHARDYARRNVEKRKRPRRARKHFVRNQWNLVHDEHVVTRAVAQTAAHTHTIMHSIKLRLNWPPWRFSKIQLRVAMRISTRNITAKFQPKKGPTGGEKQSEKWRHGWYVLWISAEFV